MNAIIQDDNGTLYKAKLEAVNFNYFKAATNDMLTAAESPFTPVPKNVTGLSGDIFIKDGSVFVYCCQNFMNVNTKWTPWQTKNAEGKDEIFLEPTYFAGLAEQKVVFDLSNNPLYLIYSETDGNNPDFFAIFVEAPSVGKINTYYMALPNMFDSGAVCLGDNNKIVGDTVIDRFNSAKKIFNDSVFGNTDLYTTDKVALKAAFFVDPSFKQINDPYNGKLKFVNEEVNAMVKAIVNFRGGKL